MSFEIEQDEPLSDGIRRTICKRIDRAIKVLSGKKRPVSDYAVHEARRRFKEIRGALRLVRRELGEKIFQRENRAFRDAGRPLSVLRDAQALIESLDDLIAHSDTRIEAGGFAQLRRVLVERRSATRQRVLERDPAGSTVVRKIRMARKRARCWPLQDHGWKTVKGGLHKVYTQGRRAMKKVHGNASDKTLHEWRKRTKNLRYGLELLRPVLSGAKHLVKQAHRLTNLLGDDHDLAVLRRVAQEVNDEEFPVGRESLLALIDQRRDRLQKKANKLGRKLYDENTRKFVSRMKHHWKTA